MKNIVLTPLLALCAIAMLSCRNSDAVTPGAAADPIAGPYQLKLSSLSETAAVLTWRMPPPPSPLYYNSMQCMIECSTDSVTYRVVDTVSATVTTRSVAGLYRAGTSYTFRIRVKAADGYSYYSDNAARTLRFYDPSSLRVQAMNETSASLSWIYQSTFETGFLIERSTDGIAYELVDSTSAGVCSKDVAGSYEPGLTYSFRVRARALYHMSAYSSAASRSMTAMVMLPVAGGTFQMGSTAGKADEMPVHSVTVGSFSIGEYEITQEKWNSVASWAVKHGYTDLPLHELPLNPYIVNRPVSDISWYDAVKWCNARSEKEGLAPTYYTNNSLTSVYRTGMLNLAQDAVKWTAGGYRLPTEAEWEFAARGGTASSGFIYSGSNTPGDVAWYYVNTNNTLQTVGSKPANELGIHDMSGNAGEWCWDYYGPYSTISQTDPKGSSSMSNRIWRGGTAGSDEAGCRTAIRTSKGADQTSSSLGFRCVRK